MLSSAHLLRLLLRCLPHSSASCDAAFAGSHDRDTDALAAAIEERGGRQYVTTVSTGTLQAVSRPGTASHCSAFTITTGSAHLRLDGPTKCPCGACAHHIVLGPMPPPSYIDAAEDLPPRRSIALPPEEYLAGLRTPAPELVLAEYRLQTNGGAAPIAPPAPVDDIPADEEAMTEASKDGDGPQSPVSEAGASAMSQSPGGGLFWWCLCKRKEARSLDMRPAVFLTRMMPLWLRLIHAQCPEARSRNHSRCTV